MDANCNVCFRQCNIREGGIGFCRARGCQNGRIICTNYGKLTSLALDPIEKKPLAAFHPGSMILSAGSYGCNLRCPFCQNHEISMADADSIHTEYCSPRQLADMAKKLQNRGNIGVAFTYNEPIIGWEYVRDTAKLVHENGMLNVIVTNGNASIDILEEILPYIDAMNIDLKSFRSSFYTDYIGGDLDMVKAFIDRAVKDCHVELTTLLIPGENDTEKEIREEASWISSLNNGNGRKIPLHLSRFFPRYHITDKQPTNIKSVYHLAETARGYLNKVYTGNR